MSQQQAFEGRRPTPMPVPVPVPVTVIGGFLGSGKTTLLNHILTAGHGIRAGVLVNDFGAVNIDARMVVGVEGDIVDLANGCICCSIREDLLAACLGLLQRPDPPDVLIVETSGVADPLEVMRTFDQPELASLLALDSLIAVVDAEAFPSLIAGDLNRLARAQVHAADLVVLNKIDLVDRCHLEQVRTMVREIAPNSKLLDTSHGRVPLGVVFGDRARSEKRAGAGSRPGPGAEHDHTFSTWHWTSDQALSFPKLRAVVESLPDTVYRAKGIVFLEELPFYRIAFQMVGKRFNFRDTEPWGSDPTRSDIVLIAAQGAIDESHLQTVFDTCIGTGDESQSPILRLTRRLAGEGL